MKIVGIKIRCLSVLAVVFLLLSCSTSKPEITYGFLQLVLYQGETKPTEQFSFFILPEDEDGIENLDELYLYHDKDQLRWKLTSADWVVYTQDEKTWIGSRSIAVKDGGLPRGVYRAVLVNKGGERGEREFVFDAEVRYAFPTLDVADGYYTINSRWPVNRLVCYDRSGNYVTTVESPPLSGSVSNLNLPSSVRTAALWAEDTMSYCSAFTDVVSLN